MTTKNHSRSPDKIGFSVALPKDLVRKIEVLAKKEKRNRNNAIEWLLSDAVGRYFEGNKAKILRSLPDTPSNLPKHA